MRVPTKKDYPKYIYLKCDRWHLKFVNKIKDRTAGTTDPEKFLIRIDGTMSDNEIFKTFIHEMLHVIEFSWPMKIKHKQVYKMEKAIFSLLVDNWLRNK